MIIFDIEGDVIIARLESGHARRFIRHRDEFDLVGIVVFLAAIADAVSPADLYASKRSKRIAASRCHSTSLYGPVPMYWAVSVIGSSPAASRIDFGWIVQAWVLWASAIRIVPYGWESFHSSV